MAVRLLTNVGLLLEDIIRKERRLDLDRPELQRNPTAAFFRLEANEALEALPGLYRDFDSLLNRENRRCGGPSTRGSSKWSAGRFQTV
jgi:hypothetical protein